MFAAVALLVFDRRQRALRWSLALLCAGCCVLVQVAAPHDESALPISAAVARVIAIVSALGALGTMLSVVDLFASDTARAEARGPIPVKGKGELETFLLKRPRARIEP